jgi:Ca2+-binding EF-hand superfamily protein
MRKIAYALLFLGAAAQAEGFMPWTEIMAKYDLNHDGGVSMEESRDVTLAGEFKGFAPWFADHFAKLDTNGDGMVDSVELAKMMKAEKHTDQDMANAFYKDLGFMPTNPETHAN